MSRQTFITILVTILIASALAIIAGIVVANYAVADPGGDARYWSAGIGTIIYVG